MISFLKGTIHKKTNHGIVLLTSGDVGYFVEMPLSLLSRDLGQQGEFWIATYVREDALRLFGFEKFEEKILFETLIKISGVGPQIALAVLSTFTVEDLIYICEAGEVQSLTTVPGIGLRGAEKIMIELKAKLANLKLKIPSLGQNVSMFQDANDSVVQDVHSALENLGYKAKSIQTALSKQQEYRRKSFDALLRDTLKILSEGAVQSTQAKKSSLSNPFNEPAL